MKGPSRKSNDERPWLKRGISMSDVRKYKKEQWKKRADDPHAPNTVREDSPIPVNCAGAGGIAGIGTGPYPKSEPGVPKKRLKVIMFNAKTLTRGTPK